MAVITLKPKNVIQEVALHFNVQKNQFKNLKRRFRDKHKEEQAKSVSQIEQAGPDWTDETTA